MCILYLHFCTTLRHSQFLSHHSNSQITVFFCEATHNYPHSPHYITSGYACIFFLSIRTPNVSTLTSFCRRWPLGNHGNASRPSPYLQHVLTPLCGWHTRRHVGDAPLAIWEVGLEERLKMSPQTSEKKVVDITNHKNHHFYLVLLNMSTICELEYKLVIHLFLILDIHVSH